VREITMVHIKSWKARAGEHLQYNQPLGGFP